jgi:acyl-CoA synthetase (AMP-forming)/AMP-acid ligase II
MERTWLKHYPPGVPAEIDSSRYESLVALLEQSFAGCRDRTAFVCMDTALTYSDLEDASRAFGAWLQSKGLQKGARVAIMMPNVPQYPIVIVGILRAGYTVVNINPLYTARELQLQLGAADRCCRNPHRRIERTNIRHRLLVEHDAARLDKDCGFHFRHLVHRGVFA